MKVKVFHLEEMYQIHMTKIKIGVRVIRNQMEKRIEVVLRIQILRIKLEKVVEVVEVIAKAKIGGITEIEEHLKQ